MIDYVNSLANAEILGILQVNQIVRFQKREFSFRGHIVDNLGTRRAVDILSGVYPSPV